MAKFKLRDKTVIITGASGGIGSEIARAFARRGSQVVLSGRNLELLKQVEIKVKEIGAKALIVPADVTSFSEMQGLVNKALDWSGRLDVMVLGAGFGVLGKAKDISLELWRKQFEVNFFGVLNGFYAGLPHFQKQKSGQFIIINSLAGRIALPLNSAYCASKFALWGFADSTREELRKDNIDLISIYPSFVKTRFQANIISPDYNVPSDLAWKMRGDSPEEIAEKVVRASERRKGEVLCTLSGNLGARFLPMSYFLSRNFQRISYFFTQKLLEVKEN